MRPVILLGHGLRLAGIDPAPLLELGVPVLTSWPAADLVDNRHPNYFGRPGLWGQRAANHVFYHADHVFLVGCRASLWTVGFNGLEGKTVEMLSVDSFKRVSFDPRKGWLEDCRALRRMYPWVESPTHDDPPDGIHPWRFMDKLQERFRANETVVVDMGTPLVAAHQVLRLRPPQRLLTSQGLGEMGVALPAAIGACIGTGRRVICLHADGGMMLNIQELQTIRHHRLPVKIIVFDNQCYGMIRQTQETAGYALAGVDEASGMSTPDYTQVVRAFGIRAAVVRQWREWAANVDWLLTGEDPALLVYRFPYVDLLPKLLPIYQEDGSVKSPAFHEMSPRL